MFRNRKSADQIQQLTCVELTETETFFINACAGTLASDLLTAGVVKVRSSLTLCS